MANANDDAKAGIYLNGIQAIEKIIFSIKTICFVCIEN